MQCPPDELKKFRRSSARGGLCAEKTQPLGDKVEALVDFLVPYLVEAPETSEAPAAVLEGPPDAVEEVQGATADEAIHADVLEEASMAVGVPPTADDNTSDASRELLLPDQEAGDVTMP